ncbi:MAG: hypothetical protein OQK82_06750 [Candidatus Pacearchaeota archaeon]|nr:hypothetical protein [Candidatus Pacearchaeota archaeon]
MMVEQVSSTGCKDKILSDTWADNSVLELSKNISLFFLDFKKQLFGLSKVNKFPAFINDYIKQICIPEIFAYSFCDLGNKGDIKHLVVPLESFQTYAISLYDQIEDSHLERGGEPTVLKVYGLESTLNIKKSCENIYYRLAEKLEEFVPNAKEIAQEQYNLTIRADKLRNSKNIFEPEKAILLQNLIAGVPSQKIALLCAGDDNIQTLARNMGNSISTIDDLIDLVFLEDIKNPKTTIPLSYLVDENKRIFDMSPEKAREYFLDSNSIKKTVNYIDNELISAQNILKSLDPFGKNILSTYTNKMQDYIRNLTK